MQNQKTLVGVILPASGPTDSKGPAVQLFLDALQALTAMAMNTSHEAQSLAVSVLLGLVTLAGRNAGHNSTVSITQVLSVVPPLQIIRAAYSSLPRVADVEQLHEHLVGSQFCAASLSLLQQLAVCASTTGVPQNEEIFSELLQLIEALSVDTATEIVPDFAVLKLPSGSETTPNSMTGVVQQPGRAQRRLGATEASKGLVQQGQKRPHDDRSNGESVLRPMAANGAQEPVPGHTKSGQRLRPAVMQMQVLRILTVFLSIPKPPTSSIVTVITTQYAKLQQLLNSFNGFLFHEGSEGALSQQQLCCTFATLLLWHAPCVPACEQGVDSE
jgi:hypothetical protein